MARIMSIDYGKKRTGIAVTDPLQIIATGLDTIETRDLFAFLEKYFKTEEVELLLVGDPRNLDDSPTHATPLVEKFVEGFSKKWPRIPVKKIDERFSSKLASRAMLEMGLKKKDRRNKGLIDEIAATMMLQEYLERGGGG